MDASVDVESDQLLSDNPHVQRLLAAGRLLELTPALEGRCVVVLASCQVRLKRKDPRTCLYLQLLATVKSVDAEKGTVEVQFHDDHGCLAIPDDGDVSSEYIVDVFDDGVTAADKADGYRFEQYPEVEPKYTVKRLLYARRIKVGGVKGRKKRKPKTYIYFATEYENFPDPKWVYFIPVPNRKVPIDELESGDSEQLNYLDQMAFHYCAENGDGDPRRITEVTWLLPDDADALESLSTQLVDLCQLPSGSLRGEDGNIICPDDVVVGQNIRIRWGIQYVMYGEDVAGDCLELCRVNTIITEDDEVDADDGGNGAADNNASMLDGEQPGGERELQPGGEQPGGERDLQPDGEQPGGERELQPDREDVADQSMEKIDVTDTAEDELPGLDSSGTPTMDTPQSFKSPEFNFGDNVDAGETNEFKLPAGVPPLPPLPSSKHSAPKPLEENEKKKSRSEKPQDDSQGEHDPAQLLRDPMIKTPADLLGDDCDMPDGEEVERSTDMEIDEYGDVPNSPVGVGSSQHPPEDDNSPNSEVDHEDERCDGQQMDGQPGSYRDSPDDSEASFCPDDSDDSDFEPSVCCPRPAPRGQTLSPASSQRRSSAGSGCHSGLSNETGPPQPLRHGTSQDAAQPGRSANVTSQEAEMSHRSTNTHVSRSERNNFEPLRTKFFQKLHPHLQSGQRESFVPDPDLKKVSSQRIDLDKQYQRLFPTGNEFQDQCLQFGNKTLFSYLHTTDPDMFPKRTVTRDDLATYRSPLTNNRRRGGRKPNAVLRLGKTLDHFSFQLPADSTYIPKRGAIYFGPAFDHESEDWLKMFVSDTFLTILSGVLCQMGAKTHNQVMECVAKIHKTYQLALQDCVLAFVSDYDRLYAHRRTFVVFNEKNPTGTIDRNCGHSTLCPPSQSPADFFTKNEGNTDFEIMPQRLLGINTNPSDLMIKFPESLYGIVESGHRKVMAQTFRTRVCLRLNEAIPEGHWLFSGGMRLTRLQTEESRISLLEEALSYTLSYYAAEKFPLLHGAATDDLCPACQAYLSSSNFDTFIETVTTVKSGCTRTKTNYRHSDRCRFVNPQFHNRQVQIETLISRNSKVPTRNAGSVAEYESLDGCVGRLSSMTLRESDVAHKLFNEYKAEWQREKVTSQISNSMIPEFLDDLISNRGSEMVTWTNVFEKMFDDLVTVGKITVKCRDDALARLQKFRKKEETIIDQTAAV